MKEIFMTDPTDAAMSIAHALIIFSTVGCIVYGLLHWNREEQTEPMHIESDEDRR